MSDHFRNIYGGRAADYHAMIAAEDSRGELRRSIRGLLNRFEKPRVVDIGSGTGRFGLIAGDLAERLVAVDLYEAMLREQAGQRAQTGHAGRWSLVQSDARRLPLSDDWADVVLAGWSLGHMTGWYPDSWRTKIGAAVSEMERICRPGGVLCIAETMTTGATTAAPPSPVLAEYYQWLEGMWGFERTVLPTDFAYGSVEEAVEKMGFFFGEELTEKIRDKGWQVVPEWTGLWVK